MGVVYEVEHRLTKHRRALKVLHPHMSMDAEITTRLLREASVAGTLRTKHVVETFDAGQLDNGSAYVLMEMLEGHALADAIGTGLPVARVAEVVSQACEGLQAAHDAGIVHRDLKPDNIFVSREVDDTERVKLLDFGISKFNELKDAAGTLTNEGVLMGTPYYMSPEQTAGAGRVDHLTDIYAMGVIMYEALTGETPFQADTYPRLLLLIHQGHYQRLSARLPDLDPAFIAVVEKAMAHDPAKRFQSASALIEALSTFRGENQSLPPRTSTTGRSRSAIPGTLLSTPPGQPRSSAPAELARSSAPAEATLPARSRRPLLYAVAVATVLGALAIAYALGQGATAEDPPPTTAIPPAEVPLPVVEPGSETAESETEADVAPLEAGPEAESVSPPPVAAEPEPPTRRRRRSAMTTAMEERPSMAPNIISDIEFGETE